MAFLKDKNKRKPINNKRYLIALDNPKSPSAEQYRTLRTNIQFSSVDEEIQTILITSPGPVEGKSTTVANLAVVFSQQGKKVLLVDADLRKPTVHYTFGLVNTFGLSTVLTNLSILSDSIQKTDVDGLYVITSGPIPPNPSELIGSKAMDKFIESAKRIFDVILFDTPPVLAVTDAPILSNKCDGTIIVVSSGKTEKDQLLKTKDLLENAKGRILGTVLNNQKTSNSKKYNYYQYY